MSFKRVVIYYFSGTGNSRSVAKWIKEVCDNQDLECQIVNISKPENRLVEPPPNKSLIGFISPTHGFDFPAIMRGFIKRFPKTNSCSAFIINTRAGLRFGKVFLPGLSGVLHYTSSVRLKLKGYKIVGLRPVDLPSNWVSLHPAVRKKGIKLMYQRCEPKVKRFAQLILSGKRNYRALFDIIQDIVISPITILYSLIGRYFLAKTFVASHHCTNCKACVNSCPVKAIKIIDDRPFWTLKCESCMHCMNVCPHKAIETAHGFAVGILYLFTVLVMDFGLDLAKDYLNENWQEVMNSGVIRFVIASLIALPFVFISYRIVHYLMRFRIFEWIITHTSLTHYKFWGKRMTPPK